MAISIRMRYRLLKSIRDFLIAQGKRCEFVELNLVHHLLCNSISPEGKMTCPVFYLSISKQSEWFLCTYSNHCYQFTELPIEPYLLRVFDVMNSCLQIPDDHLASLKLEVREIADRADRIELKKRKRISE